MMNFRRNKKAQVYIVFVALFTVIALTYALVSLNDVKNIKDSNGKDMIIGTKQSEVFAAIQDGDSINLFLQKAAELSASAALGSIQRSCLTNQDLEASSDRWKSPCGKYIYPQWSNAEEICLPNCQQAFIDTFTQDLSTRLNAYSKQTGVNIPKFYDFNMTLYEDYFVLKGVSSTKTQLKVLDLTERPLTSTIDVQKNYLAPGLEPVPGEPPDTSCASAEICNDGIDNNCDHLLDCEDEGCINDEQCVRNEGSLDSALTCGGTGECLAGTTTDSKTEDGYAGKITCTEVCTRGAQVTTTLRCGDGKFDPPEQCDGQTSVKCTTPNGKDGIMDCKQDCAWSDCIAYEPPSIPEPAQEGENPNFGLLSWGVESNNKILTSCFGTRVLKGNVESHPAIDIAGALGDPVVAAAEGIVESTNLNSYGIVIINHDQEKGLKTRYLHLDTILVKPGQHVTKGMQIGTVGGRGANGKRDAFAPHLHFEVIYDNVPQGLKYEKSFSVSGQALTPQKSVDGTVKIVNQEVTEDRYAQELVIEKYGLNRVNPLCFLSKDSYSKKQTNNAECSTPVNTELDEVCKEYDFPAFSVSVSGSAADGSQTSLCSAFKGKKTIQQTAQTWGPLVKKAAAQTGISECLILGYIQTESAGDPCAVSEAGAVGLMQMLPPAAKDVGLSVPSTTNPDAISPNDPRLDPATSIIKGTAYVKRVRSYMEAGVCDVYRCSSSCRSCGTSCSVSACSGTCSNCLRDYSYDDPNVIRAYNAGAGAVTKNLVEGKPLTAEAQAYPSKVLSNANEFRRLGLCTDTQQQLTGGAVSEETSEAGTESVSLINDFGTYSFNTGFTVPVYKKIDNPLEPLTTWFESTWNECQDEPGKCINAKMSDFNAKTDADAKFTLHFADQCEDYPVFYDFMESLEDCFSNGKYSCSCRFDFSKASSRKDLNIVFELDTGTVSLFTKEADGMKQIATHTLYYGKIKPTLSDQRYYTYRLDFDEKTGKLQSATLTPFKEGENPGPDTYFFNNYNIAKITKTSQTEGQFVENDLVECVYSKDKFRLCAKPKPGNPELFQIKFALQLKDQAPPAVTKSDVQIITADESASSDADNIMSLAGILGLIYPPLGFIFNLASILQALDDFKPRSMEIMVNVPLDKDGKPLDIVGYELYCNDYLTDLLPKEYVEKFKPSNFVVMANQQISAINAKTTSQLDRYVNTNTYADFLNKIDCDVPVSKADGQTVMVPAIKGSVKDDKVVFNLKQCGEFAIIADKVLKKNYCITLIPVDKNGNKLVENTITNCAQTNSLMDMAIDELIKRELGDFIPVDLVPKDLQPYIKLPTSSDIVDAAMGTRDFNLVSVVNSDKLTGDLKDYAGSFIVETVNKEILGNSFIKSVDQLNIWDKQTVLSTLSNEIKQEDAKMLFNAFVSGQNMDVAVKQAAYSKGVDYIDQSKAPEFLKEVAKGENPESLAYEMLIEAAQKEITSDQKKAALLEVIQSGNAQEIADKLIEKAVEKGCAEHYGISVDQAVACLRDDEITAVYDEMISSMQTPEAAKQALLNKAIDEMGDKAPAVLKTVVLQQDFQGAAMQMLEEELDKMDDSQKKQFIMDALDGKMPDASIIQQELATMIPALNNSYITAIMQNGNVKSLLESTLKEELQSQLDSFISGKCVPVSKDTVGNI